MTECPHGLEADWCSLCKHPPKAPVVTYGRPFRSHYDGSCAVCREATAIGELIAARLVDGDAAGYVHEECLP